MIKTIVLDFNGTLLDDVSLSLASLNVIVKKYLQRGEVDIEEYRRIFTFPVKDYYERVGFSFDTQDFKEIGSDWFRYYVQHIEETDLFPETIPFLENIKKAGKECVLLSAAPRDYLLEHCERLGILSYFSEVWGLEDIYAHGKKDVALKMMKNRNAEETIFIGDTLHDKEAAQAVGAKCVLVAKGHQALEVLEQNHDSVVSSLLEVDF